MSSSFSSMNEDARDASFRGRDDELQRLNQPQSDDKREQLSSSTSSDSDDDSDAETPANDSNPPSKVESITTGDEGGDASEGLSTIPSANQPTPPSNGTSSENISTDGATVVAPGLAAGSSDFSDLQLISSTPDDGLQIGEMFGQFKIVRYVGGGGMGHVYEAFDCDLERKVAIKVLPKKKAEDSTLVARFLNEAKSTARLNHENIAQVYLYGNVSGIPYIALEYVEGVNLRDWVRNNGALDLSDAINYVLQTASALSHAASHGVTHRDVKPSNIIVTPQKRVKLIDMGLARILRTSASDDLTESGVTLGTFDYISPEQAKDPRLADVRSDVYSLGCSFYFFLTASPPFPDGTALQKLLMHQGDEAPDVRDRNPAIPVEIAAVVKKMMMKNPNDRYQTPDILIQDLLQIVEMLHLDVAQRDYIGVAKRGTKARTIPLSAIPAIVAALVFAFLISFLYFFDSGSDLTLPTVESPPVVALNVEESPSTTSAGGEESESNSSDVVSTPQKISPDEGGDGSNSLVVNEGVEYESVDLDALYTAAFTPTLEETPALFFDATRTELRLFLRGDVSVADDSRAAFGWSAAPIRKDKGVRDSSPDTFGGGATFSANVLETSEDNIETSSKSFTAYSFLDASVNSNVGSTTDVVETARIVDGRGEEPNTYATLQSALTAPSRDPSEIVRVELRFNDSMETLPISLFDRNVEIIAAEGLRPTLVFKSSETTDGGWGRRMFLLDSSKLVVRGVDIDFTVPSQEVVASEWSVFEALGASELTLEESTVSVCNMTGDSFTSPLHSNVAFFRASDDSLLDSTFDSVSSNDDQSAIGQAFKVHLSNVLARGEATLFSVEKAGGRYEARNSGFNISGPFLHYVDSESVESDAALRFTFELDHVVALGRSCLVRLDSELKSEPTFEAEVGTGEDRSTSNVESESIPQRVVTRKLPHFEVKCVDSIFCFENQPIALVTSPALVDLESFENEWTFDRLIALDVASFWRRRSSRTSSWQDYAFEPRRYRSESATLKGLNSDAHERFENISPHLFSLYDFSNWILNPIHTASNLSDELREVGEEIKNEFVDKFSD